MNISFDCPDYLDDVARKEWNRIIGLIKQENKEFTSRDIKALEGYCSSYSNWRKFEQLADEAGYIIYSPNGYPQQHPYCQLAKNAQQEMRNWMKELGLTVASRSRINKNSNVIVENKTKDEEEMEDLMS